MQTVSNGFTTACSATGQRIVTYLEIAWTNTGSIAGARGSAGWTDETAHLLEYSGALRINPPGENLIAAGDIGSLDLTLNNNDYRYSWLNAASPLYAQFDPKIGPAGRYVRLWQGLLVSGSPEYVCIFTGIIGGFRIEVEDARITLQCRDWGYRYLQDKRSTDLYQNYLPNEWTAVVAALGGITQLRQDVGIFQIPFCWMDDESIVEEIWQTWQADCGVAYFDQLGYLNCENALHWLSGTHATSVWTFDEAAYQRLVPETDLTAIASKITVEWSGRTIAPLQVLYQLDEPKTIMPGQHETWTARYQNATSGAVNPNPNDPYNDYHLVSVGGVNMSAQVTIALTEKYAQQCTITVTNNSALFAARLTYLQIRGYPLLGGPTEQEEEDVAEPPFSYARARQERGNPYLQTQTQGRALAKLLALRCSRMRPIWVLDGVIGVPQLELTDRVTIANDRLFGTGETKEGIVVGIGWQGRVDGGFTQRVSVMDTTDMAEYAGQYFIIGTDTLGMHKRAYY